MTSYATVEEYRTGTGDAASNDARIEQMLSDQSSELRLEAGITEATRLTEDQLNLCRMLVIDACKKALVQPMTDVIGSMAGMTQVTFSANGYSGSWQNANGSGSAYFDRGKLKTLKKSLGHAQSVGTVMPSYGRLG